jgi:hypothetical protein
MAERTPDTHWRVSPLRSNPIIGLDLRAGTLFVEWATDLR